MKNPKLTPWFPQRTKPVHVGVYEVAPSGGYAWWSHWNGTNWGYINNRFEDVLLERELLTHTALKWRGLAADPSAEVFA